MATTILFGLRWRYGTMVARVPRRPQRASAASVVRDAGGERAELGADRASLVAREVTKLIARIATGDQRPRAEGSA